MIILVQVKVLPCQKYSNFLTRFITFKFTSLFHNIVIIIISKYIKNVLQFRGCPFKGACWSSNYIVKILIIAQYDW